MVRKREDIKEKKLIQKKLIPLVILQITIKLKSIHSADRKSVGVKGPISHFRIFYVAFTYWSFQWWILSRKPRKDSSTSNRPSAPKVGRRDVR